MWGLTSSGDFSVIKRPLFACLFSGLLQLNHIPLSNESYEQANAYICRIKNTCFSIRQPSLQSIMFFITSTAKKLAKSIGVIFEHLTQANTESAPKHFLSLNTLLKVTFGGDPSLFDFRFQLLSFLNSSEQQIHYSSW